MKDFTGKVAVVTGGASGIGLALGERFARQGMRVALADVEKPALDAAVARLAETGAPTLGVVTDVTKLESVRALERQVVDAWGAVHVLCNNAGVGAQEDVPIWELPTSDWRWTFAVNVWGVIHGIQAFVPGMIARGEEGHVINTSSGNGGLILVPSTPIYSASKAAVSSITETLHLQLVQRQSKLQAHVLYPGPHMVESNIFSASRNRSAEFEREIPPAAPPITLETLRQLAKGAGIDLQTTLPEEVAEHAFAGIRAGSFYILPTGKDGEARLRARFDGILARRNPVPQF